MAKEKVIRLSQAARKLKLGANSIVDALTDKGIDVEKNNPNAKITYTQYNILAEDFGMPLLVQEAKAEPKPKEQVKQESKSTKPSTPPKVEQEKETQTKISDNKITAKSDKLQGLKVLDKIDLNGKSKPKEIEKEDTSKKDPKPETESKETNKVAKTTEKISESTEKVDKDETKKESTQKPEEEKPVVKKAKKIEQKATPDTNKTKDETKTKSNPNKKQEEDKDKVKTNDTKKKKPAISKEKKDEEDKDTELIKAKGKTLKGLTVKGKIELPVNKAKRKSKKPIASSDESRKRKRKKRIVKRVSQQQGGSTDNRNNQNKSDNRQQGNNNNRSRYNSRNNRRGNNNRNEETKELSDKQIQDKIKATLAKLTGGGKGKSNKRSKSKRDRSKEEFNQEEQQNILKVTEFISVNDLANIMDVPVTKVISTCMSLGIIVSINQRLDAEVITYISEEFDYDKVEFISAEVEDIETEKDDIEDNPEDLKPRAPIVTIMGHVDHGKTSLLDYIRNANVIAQEAGGITQHIGAYDVQTEDGERIAFLDTPGHEAFTAMRARGAKVTDIVIIVVAADDSVMPQTEEAINHAQNAGVPIIIAINKVDKPSANAEKIKEELSSLKTSILVESWGGKYQDQEISAKTGKGIPELLEKVLLEAEMLELKANPSRKANGTIIEAALDKGKGYVATVLVQKGTLKVGDVVLAGSHYGKVKAMSNHLGKRVKTATPSTPVQVLGLDGAPQSGDVLKVMDSEREARDIAIRRSQIMREQTIKATKGLTLEEIARRRALNDFQELKVIVKGDVDGSVEALSDSLLKLSTPEVEVKIIHKGVGQISEADVMLASASEAVIIGFQVRPSLGAKKAAENEGVQIKLYSIIYKAIEEVRDAMEGMLAPDVVEEIVGNAEVRQIFKISKVGTVAGCYVTDGYINRNNKIRIIRDGIVIYEGEIGELKRFKEDTTEVKSGYECGLSIKSFNDLKEQDVIESYEVKEVKRTL